MIHINYVYAFLNKRYHESNLQKAQNKTKNVTFVYVIQIMNDKNTNGKLEHWWYTKSCIAASKEYHESHLKNTKKGEQKK